MVIFLYGHHESHYDSVSLLGLAAGVLRDKSVCMPAGVQNLTARKCSPNLTPACIFFFVHWFERERNIDWLPPVYTLTGDQTLNLLVYTTMLQPTGQPSQG